MFEHIDPLCRCEGKVCRGCTQLKCFLAFYKNPRGVNGLGSKCKECYRQIYYERKNAPPREKVEIPEFTHIDLLCNCEGRYCRTCSQWRCQQAFSKDSKGANWLSARCKECVKSYQQAHLDRINERRRENRREKADHYSTYLKEFHKKNPEPKRARDRKYRQEHIEHVRAIGRVYQAKMKTNEEYIAKRKAYNHKYTRLHPEKSAQYFNNRRARLQQANGSFTSKEWKKLCKHYNYTCLCCRRQEPEIKLTVDHVVPLSKGGANSIENIQPLCQSCNSSKHRRIIDYRINWP